MKYMDINNHINYQNIIKDEWNIYANKDIRFNIHMNVAK